MLNAKAFANALTVVMVAVFIICRVAAWLVPDFLFKVGQSWFHTMQLESNPMSNTFFLGTFVLGLISATVVTWVMGYTTIILYNKWAAK